MQVLVAREQLGRALVAGVALQTGDLVDVHEHRLAATTAQPRDAARTGRADALAAEDLDDDPVAVALLLHRDVLDGRVVAVLGGGDRHGAVEQLGQHQGLVGALLEAAHVDQAGGDDLPGVDARHPGHRHEHPAPAGHLDDQADDARRAVGGR